MADITLDRKWSRDDESDLIEFYKANELLWNTKDREYFRRDLKAALLSSFVYEMNTQRGKEWSVQDVKKKMLKLRAMFARELKKLKAKNGPGAKSGEEYESKWIHFKHMMFLEPSMNLMDIGDYQNDKEKDEKVVEVMGPDKVPSPPSTSKSTPQPETPNPEKKMKCERNLKNEFMRSAIEALNCPNKADGVQSFLNSLAESMRDLPRPELERCKLKIQEIVVRFTDRNI